MSDTVNKTNNNLEFKGNKLNVVGNQVTEGSKAPDVTLTGNDLGDLSVSSLFGEVLIVSVVPSLDTPVCSLQTKRFNQELSKIQSKGVRALTVSMDLPFAQKRWCGAEDATNVVTASDYKYRKFGEAYGCQLPDLGLLARSLFVVDKSGVVRHVEYVKELSSEPNYDAALKIVSQLTE